MSWPKLTRDIKRIAQRVRRENLTPEQMEDAAMIFMRELGFESGEKNVVSVYSHDTLDAGHQVSVQDGRFCIEYWFGEGTDPMFIPYILNGTGEAFRNAFEEMFGEEDTE